MRRFLGALAPLSLTLLLIAISPGRADMMTWMGFGFSAEDRARLHEINDRQTTEFLASLPKAAATELRASLRRAFESPESPILLPNRKQKPALRGEPVFLFIHGMTPEEELDWWAQTFHRVREQDRTAYLHKWSRFRSLAQNAEELAKEIAWVSRSHRHQQVFVVGFSAGGSLGLLAMDILMAERERRGGRPFAANVRFHTVASPLNGTGGGSPTLRRTTTGAFAGLSVGSIAAGVKHELTHRRIDACEHWITTNCQMDINACRGSSGIPQVPDEGMPCGSENTHPLPSDMTHSQALNSVVEELFSR